MAIFLRGLAISHFRGIKERQVAAPLTDFNFFIGSNNAGKSTVLDFIFRYAQYIGRRTQKSIDVLDTDPHIGHTASEIKYSVGYGRDHILREISRGFSGRFSVELFNQMLDLLIGEHDLLWIDYDKSGSAIQPHFRNEVVRTVLKSDQWSIIAHQLSPNLHFQGNFPGLVDHVISEVYKRTQSTLPTVQLIPAKRQVRSDGGAFEDRSGRNLIDRLMELQQPEHHDIESRAIFRKINEFVQFVTGVADARIEIPHNKKTINIMMNDRWLPLHSVGTGIEEVILIGAFCSLSEKEIICLEEPEIHLHPVLQRKLIQYLQSKTNNQYFIATHSASFIDTADANTFHVAVNSGCTNIAPVLLRHDKHAVCDDLGIRASDLVQSNCIIWVEGPSDRIYLNAWIATKDNSLSEGIHYSIMFYGGRLLSHLTANDGTSFIDLIAINRNSAILIDSDKRNEDDSLNNTKQRIVAEFDSGAGFAWVTAGREVENYFDPEILHEMLSVIYANVYDRKKKIGKFDKSYEFYRKPSAKSKELDASGAKATERREVLIFSEVDKIELALKVCERAPDLTRFDLASKIDRLCSFIRRANGL